MTSLLLREENYLMKIDARIESLLTNGRMDECNEIKVKVKRDAEFKVISRSPSWRPLLPCGWRYPGIPPWICSPSSAAPSLSLTKRPSSL